MTVTQTGSERPFTSLPLMDGQRHTCDGGALVWLDAPGVLRVKLPEGKKVTGEHALSAADMVRTLADGQLLPLLIDLTRVNSVEREARSVYDHQVFVSAIALVGEDPVDRVLAHYFLAASPQKLPVRFFESEAEALQWLGALSGGG